MNLISTRSNHAAQGIKPARVWNIYYKLTIYVYTAINMSYMARGSVPSAQIQNAKVHGQIELKKGFRKEKRKARAK
jgi:hypothetical protein